MVFNLPYLLLQISMYSVLFLNEVSENREQRIFLQKKLCLGHFEKLI